MPDFLTLKEAADLSGYHQDYLSQLIRADKLRGKRMGKEWLVTKISLAQYLELKAKTPISRGRLKLPWWRKHTKLVVTTVTILVIALGTLTAFNLETLLTVIAAGDFGNSRPTDIHEVLISDAGNESSRKLVITSYTIDEGGDLEISISTGE